MAVGVLVLGCGFRNDFLDRCGVFWRWEGNFHDGPTSTLDVEKSTWRFCQAFMPCKPFVTNG